MHVFLAHLQYSTVTFRHFFFSAICSTTAAFANVSLFLPCSSLILLLFYRMSQLEDYSRIQSSVVNETAMQQRSLRTPNGLNNGSSQGTNQQHLASTEEQLETEEDEEEAKESIQPILRRQDNVTSCPTPSNLNSYL